MCRKAFQRILGLATVMLLLVGCGSGQAMSTSAPTPATTSTLSPATPTPILLTPTAAFPRFINHTPPELAVDFEAFERECGPLGKHGVVTCKPETGPLAALECDEISGPPSDLLGALDPAYPIAYCTTRDGEKTDGVEWVWLGDYAYSPQGDYFYVAGCMLHGYERYVVFRDTQFVLIETEDEFRGLFAPIETADEALSYVLAVTGLNAYYGLELDSEYEYFVDVIEDTHVDPVADGYVVHLFQEEICGCGPHPTSAVDFHVTPEGFVRQIRLEAIYKDPAQDNMCID